ncbi:hypothetical protein [Planococcus koreensis]|uniref:hypothetical protein n=1 Tax=Planococcus koreensis TaxID=112331 RepID=UPI0039FD7D68
MSKAVEDIQFLKDLQKQMQYESEHDYDMQASPRFWVIMDYRIAPGNADCDNGYIQRYWNNGDHSEFADFEELKQFIEDEYYEDCEDVPDDLQVALESGDFDGLWELIQEDYNEDGYYSETFVKEEEYIVPNTLFLTKEEAKQHIAWNKHNLSSKAHTYAMTALRAPKVERLLKILNDFDFNLLEVKS